MDIRRENSDFLQKDYQTEVSWIPATPVKPGLAEAHLISRDREEKQTSDANSIRLEVFLQGNQQANYPHLTSSSPAFSVSTNSVVTNSVATNRSSNGWEEDLAARTQLYSNNVGIYNNFSMGNGGVWNSIPCTDLLALADAALATSTSAADVHLQHTICERSNGSKFQINSNSVPGTSPYGQPIPYQHSFDLNSPPRFTEAYLTTSLSPQLAPVTPDHTRRVDIRQVSDPANSSKDGVTSQQTDKQDNEVGIRYAEHGCTNLEEQEQLLQEQQSCAAAISIQLEENHNPDEGSNEGNNLNKTPQQKPRRRKHRPKVVIEGQQRKRTRNSGNQKPDGATETPKGKRKYVRRKGLSKPTANLAMEEASETIDPQTVVETRRSCRRYINFDVESQVRDERSSCTQEQNMYTGVPSTVQLGKSMDVTVERSMDEVVEDYPPMPERQAPGPSTPSKTDLPCNKSMDDAQNTYQGAKCRIHFSHDTHDKEGNSVPNSINSSCSTSASECFNEGRQARGVKRDHSLEIAEMELSSLNAMGARYNSLETYLSMFTDYSNGSIPGVHFPVIYKKKRTEKGHSSVTSSSTLSSVTATQNLVRVGHLDPLPNDTMSRLSAAQFNASTASEIAAAGGGKDEQQSFMSMQAFGHMDKVKKKRTKSTTRVRDLTSFADILLLSKQWPAPTNGEVSSVMQRFEASQQPHTCMEALAADIRATVATKKRTKRHSVVSSIPSTLYHQHHFLTNSTGIHPGLMWKSMDIIDVLSEHFAHLDINAKGRQVEEQDRHALIPYLTRYQEQNAVVLYQRNGTIIPFEGSFNPVRRRKPRPKVDLDDETTRVWKLLLENINSQGIDGTDEEKAKWWEEERSVFRGRADSFIARMHLVQGDRRFSQWKGSVVDSVIGVFLTQNVSDHLSSSAFMSLAARFPLKSSCTNGTTHEERTSESLKEAEVSEVYLDETITWNDEKSNQTANDQQFMTLQDGEYNQGKVISSTEFFKITAVDVKSRNQSDCEIIGCPGSDLTMTLESTVKRLDTHISATVANAMGDQREMDDVISSQNSIVSSQNSVDSSIAQTAEKVGSCSQRNSGTELLVGSKPDFLVGSTSFVDLLQMQGATMLHGVYSQERPKGSSNNMIGPNKLHHMGELQEQNEAISKDTQSSTRPMSPNKYSLHLAHNLGASETGYCDLLRDESRYPNFNKTDEGKCVSEQSGLSAESASQTTVQKDSTMSPQEATKFCNNNHVGMTEIFHSQMEVQQTLEENCNVQHILDVSNFSGEISDVMESTTIVDHTRKTGDRAVESNLNDHADVQRTVNGMDEGTSKAKKGRFGKGKQIAVEWDNLRKQAQVNGKSRERTPNTMDSLDYEAVRCAHVDEIADTIKERGMNNMLAERIKDFLNRLVRDHGSIDLEWLRDVPPDKAKEYLLSVRGLGLKSVECVRLLTLHHLAFPVDTNVGRIAVRLGWVPLQPLPESLQLHLLELYPVLESIQKYLWPRLCKLDQRTLYELHYQMITFGKVFCTKSKPNCNACPMRGECRHFASAFASARLALPAPEEKSIVATTENSASNQMPTGIINGLQLPPPPSNHQLQQQSVVRNCGPVIEEPATPEPEPIIEVPATPESEQIQYQETDIEDTTCEDPEEIPIIKLNIEEFTQNLQNYMEKNMELGEGDMSRALVALTPEAASIPVPKLKNMSRLRTEHQVYELPDSHPLLERLDKREPDDPCSYLLAIWTPGETADSIQPPEERCSSQESGSLCNLETCFSCNSVREANSQIVRGTLLIPCRTAMRGSFPLNGTYFQVNEVFADHDSSLNPIEVPRSWIWNLPRRTVYFGTSIPTIFKGLTTEGIQYCFWRGFVCVRGFDQKTRAPRPLMARLHFPASKLTRTRGKTDEN